MRTSSSVLVLFVAFVLVFAYMEANAKRLSFEETQKLRANLDRKLTNDQQKSNPNAVADAVPTAVANGAKDTDKINEVVTDQNQGKSGAAEKNNEDDKNPTFRQFRAGSNSDSALDIHHRFYFPGDHAGHQDSSSNSDYHKPRQ